MPTKEHNPKMKAWEQCRGEKKSVLQQYLGICYKKMIIMKILLFYMVEVEIYEQVMIWQ